MKEAVDFHRGMEEKYIDCVKILDAKEKQVQIPEKEKETR